jgi:uncharacterized protein
MLRTPLIWLGRLIGLLTGGYLGYVALRGSRMLTRPDIRPLDADADGLATSPAGLGLDYEDVRFTTDDGVTLAGWLIPAGRDTRAAVIVMHGFSGHRVPELNAVVPWLQPRYHVLMFDFRGHGASDPVPVTMGALERRDVAAAVRFCESRGLGPIALVGISMGATIAILAAPDLPVAAVVADAPYADLHHPVANRLREVGYPLAGIGSRAIVAAAQVRTRSGLPSPMRAVSRIAPRGLLVVSPGADRLIEPSQPRRLYEAAREPKSLFIVPDAPHGEAYASAPEEYQRRVLTFLERYLEGAPV